MMCQLKISSKNLMPANEQSRELVSKSSSVIGWHTMYQTIGGNFKVIGYIKSLVVCKDSSLSGKRDS